MCGLKSSKMRHKRESDEQAEILRAMRVFCNSYQMQTVNESIQYVKDSNKWVVTLKQINDTETYRLEMMVHTRKSCPRIAEKRLTGIHLMPYTVINNKNGVICFLFQSLGNVRQFVKNRNLVTGKEKEMFLRHVLTDVVSAVIDLHNVGRCHLQLTWENVEVVEDKMQPQVYHGKLGALEHVYKITCINPPSRIASINHQPPELLKTQMFSGAKIDLEKAQTYILGSLMLELLVNKHMSGVAFKIPKPNLSPTSAYNNIKLNHSQLGTLLPTTSLSVKLQNALMKMLEINPDDRCSLHEAVALLEDDRLRSRSSEKIVHEICNYNNVEKDAKVVTEATKSNLSTEQMDNLSVITEDRSLELISDETGVVVDGVRVVDKDISTDPKTVVITKDNRKSKVVTVNKAATKSAKVKTPKGKQSKKSSSSQQIDDQNDPYYWDYGVHINYPASPIASNTSTSDLF